MRPTDRMVGARSVDPKCSTAGAVETMPAGPGRAVLLRRLHRLAGMVLWDFDDESTNLAAKTTDTSRNPFKRWRRRQTAKLLKLLIPVVGLLPFRLSRPLGKTLGAVVWWVSPTLRRRVLGQMELALGEISTVSDRRRWGRRCSAHFATFFLEAAIFQRLGWSGMLRTIPIKGWDEAFRQSETLREAGRGLIWIVPHLGNWEVVGAFGSHFWEETACVAKRYRVEGYQQIAEDSRRRLGLNVVYQDGSIRELFRVLRQGGVIGLLPDVDAHRLPGIFVEFLGRQAYTVESPAKLALQSGTPLMVAACVREGRGFRFVHGPPIRPEEFRPAAGSGKSGSQAAAKRLTRAWLEDVEDVVRRFPDQWVWMHRRWHSTPDSVERRRQRAQELQRSQSETISGG